MKKTLKLVGIFMLVVTVGLVGGLSAYFLISNNKTYYIYDVRIVEPVANASYFVYTDSEQEYTSMQNQTVYKNSEALDVFEIGVYAYTSTNTMKVDLSSSNSDVARIYSSGGHLYVEYKSAGEAVISASIGSVKDTITVTVYDVPAAKLAVYDDNYYGEKYSVYFPNQIVCYADSLEYSYRFETATVEDGEYSNNVDCDLLRIDYDKIDRAVFPKIVKDGVETESIYIDAKTKTLFVTCDADLDNTAYPTIPIQTYYYTDDGDIRAGETFVVKVKVITYTPQFLQIVVSKSSNFDEGYVYSDATVIDVSNLTPEEILKDTSILDEFLKYQISESVLAENNEKSVFNAYFNEKVSTIYLKFRKVYTNGHIEYLNSTTIGENPFKVEPSNGDYLKVSADGTYYVLSLSSAECFDANNKFQIKLSLEDYELNYTFKFNYLELNAENVEYFYDYDESTGIYTYTYWDARSVYDNQITDEKGNVVAFGW